MHILMNGTVFAFWPLGQAALNRTARNGKPFEKMGRKAADLNLPCNGRHGSRANEGKRLLPPGCTDCLMY
jgi:hypothetical protein